MVAALAIYDDAEGNLKQRHVNVMLETANVNIKRRDLDQINHGVISRLKAENNVDPDKLKDIVILSVNRLAFISSKDFYDFSPEEIEALAQQSDAA